jgi:hypothetical protein
MKSIFIILFTVAGITAKSQTAEDSVKQTVNRMFQGMKDADSAMVVNSFHPSAVLQTITKDGVRADSYQDFGSTMKKLKKGQLDERITYGAIHVDGALASVWTPYRLYVDGKFIHCGANSFQLVRTGGEWKIVHLIDTRRKDCGVSQ